MRVSFVASRFAVGAAVVIQFACPAVAAAQPCPAELAEANAKIASLGAATTQTAQATDVHKPRGLDLKPSGDAPRGQDIQAPRTLAGAREDIQAPRGQDFQAPRGQDVQAPRGQDIQAPRGQDIQAPRTLAGAREDIQAPRGQDLQAPRGQDVQAPRGQDQAPRGQDVQAPRGQDVQAPRGQDFQAPRGQDVQAPREADFQAPRGQDVQAPRAAAGSRVEGAGQTPIDRSRQLVEEAERACKAGDMTLSTEKAKAALDVLK